MKKLYRSKTDKVWAGVLGGLGEYMEVDPVMVRLGFAFVSLATGIVPGIIAYVVALVIVPEHSTHVEHDSQA